MSNDSKSLTGSNYTLETLQACKPIIDRSLNQITRGETTMTMLGQLLAPVFGRPLNAQAAASLLRKIYPDIKIRVGRRADEKSARKTMLYGNADKLRTRFKISAVSRELQALTALLQCGVTYLPDDPPAVRGISVATRVKRLANWLLVHNQVAISPEYSLMITDIVTGEFESRLKTQQMPSRVPSSESPHLPGELRGGIDSAHPAERFAPRNHEEPSRDPSPQRTGSPVHRS